MKRIWPALLAGCLAGLLTAASVSLVCSHFWDARNISSKMAALDLWEIAWSAAPGAFLLDALIAWLLRRGVLADRPRGTMLTIGMFTGSVLALPVLITALWLAGRGEEIAWLFHLVRGSSRINLGSALAGGAVHGLVTAWIISQPPKETL